MFTAQEHHKKGTDATQAMNCFKEFHITSPVLPLSCDARNVNKIPHLNNSRFSNHEDACAFAFWLVYAHV
jgi:hypothetical protein